MLSLLMFSQECVKFFFLWFYYDMLNFFFLKYKLEVVGASLYIVWCTGYSIAADVFLFDNFLICLCCLIIILIHTYRDKHQYKNKNG